MDLGQNTPDSEEIKQRWQYDDISKLPEPEKTRKKSFKGKLLRVIGILAVFVAGFFLGASWITSGNYGSIVAKLNVFKELTEKYALYDFDSDVAEAKLYNGYLQGLDDDDYAQYYTKEEFDQLNEEDSGQYKGIGVTVYKDADTGWIVVSEVYKGQPAYNAGVKSEDSIQKIDGTETADLTLNEAVAMIRSADQDEVTLSIVRDEEELEILVEKDDIEIETVSYEMKEDHIGYISVSQFIRTTPQKFDEAIEELLDQGMESMILDLRDNGGGLLDSCVDMVSRIIPEDKLIVYTEDKNGNKEEFTSNSSETLDIPIVILVNGNTASASEIMTGCLQDYGLATVVGTKSFGKGIVQNIYPLTDGTGVKFTVSQYYTPNGNNIHKKGIEPDVTVEITEEEWLTALEDPSTDTQLKKAIQLLKEK